MVETWTCDGKTEAHAGHFGVTEVNTQTHFEETLQRDIGLVRAKVKEMAVLSERALRASLQALVQRNRQLAYGVILRDQYIDELETDLNRLCLEFLVRHQPVAGHLRFVFTAVQINKELERIGDYAESVARRGFRDDAAKQLAQWRRRVPRDLAASALLHDGKRAHREILAAADQHAVDLIVIGRSGHTPLERILLGSTVHHVLKLARCPVLVTT